MDNFLIEISYDPVYSSYVANFSDGQSIMLAANDYHDAVLEADMIEVSEFD